MLQACAEIALEGVAAVVAPHVPARLDEAKRDAAHEAWRAEQEHKYQNAVPLAIAQLRKDSEANLAEAARLERLLAAYPDLKKHTGRWEKVAYFSKEANSKVTNYDCRHNCGCCNDSPLEIWPYVETSDGKVYSDPASFMVGERDP